MFFSFHRRQNPPQKADLSLGKDLMDTLSAHREECVGMAANMIGVRKNAIIVSMGFMDVVMFNPVLLHKDTPYEAEEGCLPLEGTRKTLRYEKYRSGILRYGLEETAPEI